jgi:Tol biopolymer transport system component
VAVAALVVAAIAVFMNLRQQPTQPRETVRFEVSSPGDRIGFFNVSPDGQKILFAAVRNDGSRGVFIRSIDSPEPKPLPETLLDIPDVPFWSADNRYIAFAREGKVRKVEVATGSMQIISDSPGALRGGAWNANGTILLGSNRGLFSVPATGGMLTQVTMLDVQRQESSHAYPVFLPDGRHFVYLRRSASADIAGIYLSSIDVTEEKTTKRLTPSDFSAGFSDGHLLFIRDEVLMAQALDIERGVLTGEPFSLAQPVGGILNVGFGLFSVFSNTLVYRRGQTVQTRGYWFERNGTRGDAIGQAGDNAELSISRDGSHLALTRRGRTWDIELSEPLRAYSTRFTFDGADENNPVWSPDNKQLVFSSTLHGAQTLHVRAADGTHDEQLLLDTAADITPNDWSPDGRYLLYTTTDPATNLDLWMLSLADRKTKPFLKTLAREGQAQISPDGRFVAYSSDDSGISEIWVRTFPDGGGPWQVSRGGGVEPRWRGDGKELFFRSINRGMTAVDVTTDGMFQAGIPHLLFEANFSGAGGANRNPRWAPTPDGKRFAAVIADQLDELTPLTVELNWQRGLRR